MPGHALLPIADRSASAGVKTDLNQTTDRWQRIQARGDGQVIYSRNLVTSPNITILCVADDWAKNVLHGLIDATNDLRPGTRVTQRIQDDLIAEGTDNRHHFGTFGPCWPMRLEILSSNFRKNQKMRLNSAANYEQCYLDGEFNAVADRPAEPNGPYGRTLAAALPQTLVAVDDPAHVAALDALHTAGERGGGTPWPNDHLQAFTSNFVIELARRGVKVQALAKWNNPWDPLAGAAGGNWVSGHPIPPGIVNSKLVRKDESGTQWQLDFADYEGPNDWDSDGVAVGSLTSINYARGTGTATWSSANGGQLTVTAIPGHEFEIGDLASLTSSGNPAIDFHAYPVTIGKETSTSQFTVSCPVDPGGTPSGVNVCNRRLYPVIYEAEKIIEFVQECWTNGDDALVLWFPHLPHNTGLGGDDFDNSAEKLYMDQVPQPAGNGLWFDGVEGDLCGTATDPPTAAHYSYWQNPLCMIASLDDAVGMVIDGVTPIVGERGFTFLLSGDNGDNRHGEQSSRGNAGAKTYFWNGSSSPIMICRGPDFEKGVRQPRLTCHADIGQTIQDLHRHHQSFLHDVRDGASWIGDRGTGSRPSIFDPAHPGFNRVLPIYGDWKAAGLIEGLVVNQNAALPTDSPTNPVIKAARNGSAVRTYDARMPSDGGDYETAEGVASTSTVPTLAQWIALQDLIDASRFDVATGTNPAHDGTIVFP